MRRAGRSSKLESSAAHTINSPYRLAANDVGENTEHELADDGTPNGGAGDHGLVGIRLAVHVLEQNEHHVHDEHCTGGGVEDGMVR